MSEQENAYSDQVSYINQGFNQASALQIRLNPRRELRDLEFFLRGSKIRQKRNKDGTIKLEQDQAGARRANEEGIQAIMMFIHSVVNSSNVQGNLSLERYQDFIADTRESLTRIIIKNSYKWKIKVEDIELILETIMNNVELFISRPVDNKERDSYSSTIRSVESSQIQNNKGGFGLPWRRGGN